MLDLAAGFCQFINTIQCGRKIAVDLNEDVRTHAASGVEVVIAPSTAMTAVQNESVDVLFVSNFFEHLPSTESLLGTLAEIKRVLRRAYASTRADARVRQNLGLVVGLQGRFAEAEGIVKADLPAEEAAANVAYLKQMLSRKDNPRAGAGTIPVAALNRPD